LVQLVLEGNLLRVGQHGGRHIRLGEKGVDTVQQKSAAGCDDAMRGVALAYRAAFVLFFVILIFLCVEFLFFVAGCVVVAGQLLKKLLFKINFIRFTLKSLFMAAILITPETSNS
jgi:hypothetical protein